MDGTCSHGEILKKETFTKDPEENKPMEQQYNIELNLDVVNTAT